MKQSLAIEFRRSNLSFLAILLAAGQVAFMLNSVAVWRGVWPEASAQIGAPWLFIGPIIAGVCALLRLRRVRRRNSDVEMHRNLVRSESVTMLIAHTCFAIGIVLSGAVCAIVVNVVAGAPPGFLWPSYILIALAFAIESVAIGHFLGSLGGPLWFAPIISVMVVFLRGAWFQGTGVGTPSAEFTRVFLAGHPYIELNWYGVVSAVVESLLVAVAAILIPKAIASFQRFRLKQTYPVNAGAAARITSFSAVMVASFVVVVSGPPLTQYRPAPEKPLCTDTAMQLCVWPEEAVYGEELTRIATNGQDVAQQFNVTLPLQMGQIGVASETQNSFDFLGGSTYSITSTVADTISAALVPITCNPSSDKRVPLDAYFKAKFEVSALAQLMIANETRPEGMYDSTGTDWSKVEKVWRSDAKQRKTWISERVSVMGQAQQEMCP